MEDTIATRVCYRCGEEKPLTKEFFGTLNGEFRKFCKACFRIYRQGYYKRNTATIKAKVKRWIAKNPEKKKETGRRNHLWRMFKITPEQYDKMLVAQGGRCAMPGCEATEGDTRGYSLHVDHDHGTGEIRALLCKQCNQNLGMYEKRKGEFEEYLARFPNPNPADKDS